MRKIRVLFCILLIIAIAYIGISMLKKEKNKKVENMLEFTHQNEISTHTEEPTTIEKQTKTYSIPEESMLHTLTQQNLPIILRFGTEYCPKCIEMEPIYESVKEKTQGKAIIEYIDKQKQPDIAEQYPIHLIPTQILVNADGTPYNGEKIEDKRFEKYYDTEGNHTITVCKGAMTEEEIMNILREMGMEE